jgi:hypothetical protein
MENMTKYVEEYIHLEYSGGLMFSWKEYAYRESDLIPEETRRATKYYKAVYDVQNWHYSLHLNLSYEERILGVLSFFRTKGKEDFTYRDIFVLDMIKDHLAYRRSQRT